MEIILLISKQCSICDTFLEQTETIKPNIETPIKALDIAKGKGKTLIKKYEVGSVPSVLILDGEDVVYNSKKSISFTNFINALAKYKIT